MVVIPVQLESGSWIPALGSLVVRSLKAEGAFQLNSLSITDGGIVIVIVGFRFLIFFDFF